MSSSDASVPFFGMTETFAGSSAPPPTPADRVRDATAALGWDEEVAESALRALARRLRTAGKTCVRCGELKPFPAFGTDGSRHDGKRLQCRTCRSRPVRRSV